MTIEENRRAMFEAAMKSKGYSRFEWLHDHYHLADIDDMWRGFILALDAVVIELPENISGSISSTGALLDAERNATISECRAAIESTGLGLKVRP